VLNGTEFMIVPTEASHYSLKKRREIARMLTGLFADNDLFSVAVQL
jgi:hypothetical protein